MSRLKVASLQKRQVMFVIALVSHCEMLAQSACSAVQLVALHAARSTEQLLGQWCSHCRGRGRGKQDGQK
eukprot:3939945-Rhodomonas_salina.1